MAYQQFNNLFDFFNYIEFCPLCKKRTSPIITLHGYHSNTINNTDLIFSPAQKELKKFSINLFNNKISENYCSQESLLRLIIGKQCNKYHFFYTGTCTLLKNELYVSNILLEKSHFIRNQSTIHFVINNDFINLISSVHITVNYSTKIISLPLMDFDFSSKKKIDKKLKIIQLLG